LTPAVFLAALWPAAAVEVHTSGDVDAVNGTNLRLKCTFSTSNPISQHLSVTWNFQPEDQSFHEPVTLPTFFFLILFYFPTFLGYQVAVTLKADPQAFWGLLCVLFVHFSVLPHAVHFSEIHFLAIAIGSACVLMIIVVLVVIICRHRRKKAEEKKMEVADTEL
ncbi:MPZL2 protein, partial [Turnix velox]|nr:MPZL2 protein [Turnix velox]